MTTKCAGLNCTSTDGHSHSPECRAEHAAAVAGGRFVKGDAGARDEREAFEAWWRTNKHGMELLDGDAWTIWQARAALSARASEAVAGEIVGPLRDDQRQRAISLYMSLPHSWESAESVITMVSASAYANGANDSAPPAASGQKLTDEQRAAALEMVRRLAHEFGDYHYHTCPQDAIPPTGPCECFAGALMNDARALLRASDSATASDKAGQA